MFVTCHPWQKDEDYRRIIEGLEPPPPPGDQGAWELHFCKWWGWNWVKKKDEEMPIQKTSGGRPLEGKKPEKKPKKTFCQSLRCKNKKDQEPLQQMYNTPSNSTIQNPKKTYKAPLHNTNTMSNSTIDCDNKKVQTLQNIYGLGQYQRSDSVVERDIEEQIEKNTRKDVSTQKAPKKKKMKEYSTTSSDEYRCICNSNGSSTEESVEYINIRCCPCCHNREQKRSVKKCTTEKSIQGAPPHCKITSTQTQHSDKKHKRRRICVICCCRCGQSCSPCYSCEKVLKVKEQMDKRKKSDYEYELHKPISTNGVCFYTNCEDKGKKHSSVAYRVAVDHLDDKSTHFSKKFPPLYVPGMPLDKMLYNNKPFNKFGIPSKSYSWIHSTKSDIWDQLSHLRINHDFSSPVSGQKYNISPIKVDEPPTEPSAVLNPLSVDEEIQSLKKIESKVKMDLQSRIMLDAVCDAILANGNLDTNSSIFLSEFTYPANVTQNESINKAAQKSPTNTKECESLDKSVYEDILSKFSENKQVNCETTVSKLSVNSTSQNNSLRDYVRSPQTYSIKNSHKRDFCNPHFSLNYYQRQEYLTSKENDRSLKLVDHLIKNERPLNLGQESSNKNTLATSKRCASPNNPVSTIKKAKLQRPSSTLSAQSTNVSDIFKKIDKIIQRSRVNNEEIQNVLNTIPKTTYQFFSSWGVSNVTKKYHPFKLIDQEATSTSSMNVTSEDIKEKNDKVKLLQTKKKKVCSRQSLIPKRIAGSKLTKKNVP